MNLLLSGIVTLAGIMGGYVVLSVGATVWYKHSFRRVLANSGYLCLTYDDGPDPLATPELLDILKANKVIATFFLLGEQAERYPDIVRRMIREGHQIGIHGFRHCHAWYSNPVRYYRDVMKTHRLLTKEFGVRPSVYRPPYGKASVVTVALATILRYRIILWNIDPRDYYCETSEQVIDVLRERLPDGGIVLLHDGRRSNCMNHPITIEATRSILKMAHDTGMILRTVAEL